MHPHLQMSGTSIQATPGAGQAWSQLSPTVASPTHTPSGCCKEAVPGQPGQQPVGGQGLRTEGLPCLEALKKVTHECSHPHPALSLLLNNLSLAKETKQNPGSCQSAATPGSAICSWVFLTSVSHSMALGEWYPLPRLWGEEEGSTQPVPRIVHRIGLSQLCRLEWAIPSGTQNPEVPPQDCAIKSS